MIETPSSVKATPILSILTVVRNAEQHLPDFLDNVCAYLNPHVELIILDGASTDNTIAILKANTHRITYWHSEPDKGIYDAMNKIIHYAKGQWYYFLGVDDRLLEGFNNLLPLLTNPTHIYCSKVKMFNPTTNWSSIVDYTHKSKYALYRGISHQCIFYPAQVFENHQYNLFYSVNADNDFNQQLLVDSNYTWEFINVLPAAYNTTGYSSTSTDYNYINRKLPYTVFQHLGFFCFLRYRFNQFKKRLRNRK